MQNIQIKKIQQIMSTWYLKNRRDLPWRKTHNPYYILVSEVMLQQTQVDRVIPKYLAFLKQFPTTKKLAKAIPAEVISAWAGLGYNRRALFLQKTAQAVEGKYDGTFPQDLEELKKLPGVGDYTARAILSFAFQEPVPMMDTNHRRIYQRLLFGIQEEKKDPELLEAAETILPKEKSYDWNQALMDFGSLVCQKKKPNCEQCPLQKLCRAYPDILTYISPKRSLGSARNKKAKIPFKQTNRYVRGRLITELRQIKQLSSVSFLKTYPDISRERFEKAYRELKADGLIIGSKRAMMLPGK